MWRWIASTSNEYGAMTGAGGCSGLRGRVRLHIKDSPDGVGVALVQLVGWPDRFGAYIVGVEPLPDRLFEGAHGAHFVK